MRASIPAVLSGRQVSVVVPTYNRAPLLERCVASVLAQTLPPSEILIVDDGSSDDTAACAAALARKHASIKLLRHPSNRGAQAARNTGMVAASSDWIGFLDVDDTYLPTSLELRVTAAERTGRNVVHSDCLVITADTNTGPVPFGVARLEGDVFGALLAGPGTLFPSLLVSRDAAHVAGPLDETLPAFQEWDFSIALARHDQFAFVDQPTFVYDRSRMDSISANPRRSAIGYEHVVRKHWRDILHHGGPAVLARHYRTLASAYRGAGDARAARRWGLQARLVWPPMGLRGTWHRARRAAGRLHPCNEAAR